MTPIEFFVPGVAKPGGSKRFLGLSSKTGRAIIADDCKTVMDWRSVVALAARRAMEGRPPVDLAVCVEITFHILRPKSHFRSGKNAHLLKDDARKFPTAKPDVLKLARSTEDAMTGIVWVDDAGTVTMKLKKRYADTPGAHIYIRKELFR